MYYCRKFIAILVLALLIFCGCNSPTKSDGGYKEREIKQSSGAFTDVTDQSKLNFLHDAGVDGSYFMPESIGSGGALFDYDNDGDLDIYLINAGPHQKNNRNVSPVTDRLFRQEQDKTFVDVTKSSGLNDPGYGMGAAVGDIDNDGDLDVYVTNYGPDTLYRNNGDGTFTNITKSAKITNSSWGTSAVFFDYDRDGFLDLYVATYLQYDPSVVCTDRGGKKDYCGPAGFRGLPDVLYRNNGNGTFTDVSVASGIAASSLKGLGVVSADFNSDGYPDLYVANDGEPKHLWINQRNGTFEDQAMALGAAVNAMGQPEAGMGVTAGDADGDEDFDLFLTHLRHEKNTFYRNEGALGFQDDSWASGLAGPSVPYTGWGTGFFDYDLDGDLDLAVVNGRVTRGPLLTRRNPVQYWDDYSEPNFLFENNGRSIYQNVSQMAGSFCESVENHRGLAFGDVDNDGDLDLLVTIEGGPARLFRNDTKAKGHWLMIRAVDPDLKRDAIGAQISIVANGNRLIRVIGPGYSYLSSNDPRAHFGLGAAGEVNQIKVRWPDGTTEIFPGVKADQIITLKKGQAASKHES